MSRWLRGVLLLAIGLLIVFFLSEHLRLATGKRYAIDEFQYAHGAWLVAQGEVVYRDFFEHHFPLIHQLMALVFVALGDENPHRIVDLRLAMLPFLLLTMAAAAALNRRRDGPWSLVAALLVLMVPSYSMMAVEVRPDPLAAALFLAALAVLQIDRLRPSWRGALAGFFLVLALWGTLKVAYYGLVFPAALAADLWHHRRGKRDAFLLAQPFAFLAGAAVAALPIAIYLTVTGSWDDLWEWTIRWSFVHQFHYPGFFWTRNFNSLFSTSFWLFPFAVVGVVSTLRARPAPTSPDWLLLGALGTTLASFVWQSAAYLYSLIPFTVVLVVFTARGLVATVRAGTHRGVGGVGGVGPGIFAVVLLGLVLLVEAGRSRGALEKLLLDTNEAQHDLLDRVAVLTRPDEPVYNIAGGQVARPSVHYFYFFEAVVRRLKHDVFAEEIPRALVEKGTVAYMPGERFGRLPLPLRSFLLENFQPRDRDLWFWGRRYRLPATGALETTFTASRDGRYFVWPLDAPVRGELEVDGRAVDGPIVELSAGGHDLRFRGSLPELFFVWLPADGQPFPPRPDWQPEIEGWER